LKEEINYFFFASFVHRDEAFTLINYLWQHPTSYVTKEETSLSFSKPTNAGAGYATPTKNSDDGNFGGGNVNIGVPSSRTFGKAQTTSGDSNLSNGSGGQQRALTVEVDTATSRNALRIARETHDISASTLDRIADQGEQIDRIERDVENIHSNLDKADRLLRGIESFGGAIVNSMTKDKTKGAKPDWQPTDRTIVVEAKKLPNLDVEILFKHTNDNLSSAVFRLAHDNFQVWEEGMKKVIKGCEYQYGDIESIVLRARPQHVDIRWLNPKIIRLRFVCSYIQTLVNEFVLRTNGKAKVIFEPNAREFKYGDPFYTKPPAKRERGGQQSSGFFRKSNQTSVVNLVKDVPEDVKVQLQQQEGDLDEISDIVDNLGQMGRAMGTEIDRQTEQLDRVSNRVDQANDRVQHSNHRIKRML